MRHIHWHRYVDSYFGRACFTTRVYRCRCGAEKHVECGGLHPFPWNVIGRVVKRVKP